VSLPVCHVHQQQRIRRPLLTTVPGSLTNTLLYPNCYSNVFVLIRAIMIHHDLGYVNWYRQQFWAGTGGRDNLVGISTRSVRSPERVTDRNALVTHVTRYCSYAVLS